MADTRSKSSSKSPLRLILIILGAVAAVVAIAVLSLWLYVKGTPQYSLYLAGQAVEDRNYAEFTRYVDVDQVVDTAMDEGLAQAEREQAKLPSAPGDEAFAELGQELAASMIKALKPTLIAETKKQIRKEVEAGTFEKDIQSESIWESWQKVRSVVRHGDTADVVVRGDDGKDVKMKMRKTGGHWQVYELPIETQGK